MTVIDAGGEKICAFSKDEQDAYSNLCKWGKLKKATVGSSILEKLTSIIQRSNNSSRKPIEQTYVFCADDAVLKLGAIATGVNYSTVTVNPKDKKALDDLLKKTLPKLSPPKLNKNAYKKYFYRNSAMSTTAKEHALLALLNCYGNEAAKLCYEIFRSDKQLSKNGALGKELQNAMG